MTILESTRLHPSLTLNPATIPLSILDATVARFAPTGAIWIFDERPSTIHADLFVAKFRESFINTLARFPHWAGQLQWAPVRAGGSHTERFNRPMIDYGTDHDPGVEWTVVEHPFTAKDVVPTAQDRAAGSAGAASGVWVGDRFAQNQFLSSTLLALHNLRDYAGLPGMMVQISLLRGGGYTVGIKMAHVLADAQALMTFVQYWTAESRKIFGLESPTLLEDPVFDPTLLDRCAAGDIDAPGADPALTAVARQLLLHRYSWWDTSDSGYSPLFIPTTENSKPPAAELEHIIEQDQLSPSTPAPWLTWDLERPVRYTQLHFTGAELDQLRTIARADPRSRPDVSRLDALLAHIWAAINRARGLSTTSSEVSIDISLGVRQRVSPPLPTGFLGSPIFCTHVSGPGSDVCAATLGENAGKLRETMLRFTPEALGAMLHDMAFEISPQRLWMAFLGSRHTLVTSWLRLQLYEINFHSGERLPRYVHAAMPKMDGCLQVMDTAVADNGMDIALYLDAEAMERLLDDAQLRVSSA